MIQLQNIDQLDAVFGGGAMPMEMLVTMGSWTGADDAAISGGGAVSQHS